MSKKTKNPSLQNQTLKELFGFDPVVSSEDVLDNLEKHLSSFFSLAERAEIFNVIAVSGRENKAKFTDKNGQYDHQLYLKHYKKFNSFSTWRRKKSKWVRWSTNSELTSEILEVYFQYHLIGNVDIAHEFLMIAWYEDIEPILLKEVSGFEISSLKL